jgi:predicted enzyme related to lactoylglutathione lyase
LNFNVLNTRAPEAAKRFNAAVFGWTTLDLGSAEFWTLRAYGDYLEQLTPGTRERTAELGAPGFEDVVAAITPIAGDDADTPAHWSVTFATDDADATAAKATTRTSRGNTSPSRSSRASSSASSWCAWSLVSATAPLASWPERSPSTVRRSGFPPSPNGSSGRSGSG